MNFKNAYVRVSCVALLYVPMWVSGQTVTGFTALDGAGNQIREMEPSKADGPDVEAMTIDRTKTPKIALRADTSNATSVKFTWPSNLDGRTETTPPFTVFGNTPDKYEVWTPPVAGIYVFQAQPFNGTLAGKVKTLKVSRL